MTLHRASAPRPPRLRLARLLPLALAAASPFGCLDAEPGSTAPVAEAQQGITVYNDAVYDVGAIYSGGAHYQHVVDLAYGGACSFETQLGSLSDSVMTLQDAAHNSLAYDDDSGPGMGSRIVRTVAAGRYYVDVTGYSTSYTGSWTLNVTCGTEPVFLHERFVANGDAGQCGGTGIQTAPMGVWTQPILLDMDGRPGWCEQQLGVTDPNSLVSGLSLSVNFYGAGDGTQCRYAGLRSIPITTAIEEPWSSAMGIDTDNRAGGCTQVYYLSGRSDVALDIDYGGVSNGQCPNPGVYTVTSAASATILIDTDDRAGGCTQRFRLRRIPACTPRTTCNAGECDYVSDGCGGAIYCGACGGGGAGGGGGCQFVVQGDPNADPNVVVCP